MDPVNIYFQRYDLAKQTRDRKTRTADLMRTWEVQRRRCCSCRFTLHGHTAVEHICRDFAGPNAHLLVVTSAEPGNFVRSQEIISSSKQVEQRRSWPRPWRSLPAGWSAAGARKVGASAMSACRLGSCCLEFKFNDHCKKAGHFTVVSILGGLVSNPLTATQQIQTPKYPAAVCRHR